MHMGQLLISTVEYGCRNPVRALQDLAHRGVKSTLNDHFQDVTMLHTERLGEDLAEFLGTVGINPTQTAEVTKRPPVRPLNAPGGQPLNNGHGQPYDASDRSHLTDELVSRILQAEFQYLNLWPEYRTGPLPIAVSSRNQV